MAMLWVNGVAVKSPSALSWGLQDVSDSDSGRVQDTNVTMYKNRIAQKRKLDLAWAGPTPEEAAAILQAFNPEYINVTYWDAMDGKNETREFYVGDRSAPMKWWFVGGERYESISFSIIER